MTNQPLLLTRKEAAHLLGVSIGTFGKWVMEGVMPPQIPGTQRWSKLQLERAASGLSWLPPDAGPGQIDDAPDPLDQWVANDDKREQHRPIHNLNRRLESALCHLMLSGPSDGKGVRGASSKTFDEIVSKGLATKSGNKWTITNEGRRELERTDTYRNWAPARSAK